MSLKNGMKTLPPRKENVFFFPVIKLLNGGGWSSNLEEVYISTIYFDIDIYPLYIHYISTIYPLYIHYISTIKLRGGFLKYILMFTPNSGEMISPI